MNHFKIYLSPPHISGNELKYVQHAFDSNYVAPLGPMTDDFERALAEYTKIPHCLVVNSGTAALHLALKHLNISAGDIVLAASLTFIASVSNAYHMGAEIRFIDCDANTWNLDPGLLQRAIEDCKQEGRLPKVVIPTDLYGQCADYDAIKGVCDAFKIPILIDSAEALGATYKGKHAGSGGTACVLSFNGNKIITTSGGGALLSHDKSFIDHARKLSTQAREPYSYYEHREVGYNYRMSNICAAIGLGQLEMIDKKLKRRKEICNLYKHHLSSLDDLVSFMPQAPYGNINHWLTVIKINGKCNVTPERLQFALAEKNIESRPVWKPMHLQPIFRANKTYGGAVCSEIFQQGLCLPSGSALSNAEIEQICEILKKEFV